MAQQARGVGKAAPKLKYIGDKWNYKGTYSDGNPKGYYFGQQPSIIRDYIMNTLTGQNGNLLKIMWLLLSTEEGFGISQKWLMDSTGLEKNKYYKARTELVNMNWLVYDEETDTLGINYNFLWAQALLPKERRADVLSAR